MEHGSAIAALVLAADFVIRIGLSIRIIMRRRPVGVSLAWLTVVLLVPIFGAGVYLLFGELRLSQRRRKINKLIDSPVQIWLSSVVSRYGETIRSLDEWSQPVARLTTAAVGLPPVPGNSLEMITDPEAIFRRIIADIDAAQESCHLQFYIWSEGGMADEVAEALMRAAKRGLDCKILLDAVGSATFLKGRQVVQLISAGVQMRHALPVRLWSTLVQRPDLRNHRKIVVIDSEVAYVGSMNIADPRYFKSDAGVGEWVDAMVRVRGPAVEPLIGVFLHDWALESDQEINELISADDIREVDSCGSASIQVIPSGPLIRNESVRQVLLSAIYAARTELILTTPYFVPDEPLMSALTAAARRGIAVTLIKPARVDSMLVRLASEAVIEDLLTAGVEVALFEGGLLHTKSITVDGEFSYFGSLNLDLRSITLNFEITLAVYDRDFTSELVALQKSYIAESSMLDPLTCRSYSGVRRFRNNVVRLVSPLL